MLALFRNNNSTTVFILALYIAVLRLPAILGWVLPPEHLLEVANGGMLFRDTFGRFQETPIYSAIIAAILVFIQALTVNKLVDSFRLLDNRNWYPGALYGLVASFIPDFLFLSPVLVAVTFIPFSLRRIFKVYKQALIHGSVFDSAFWLTLAALFHPPAILCLPAGYFALLNLRSITVREQAVFFSGVFAPIFLALTGYFWYDAGLLFLQTQFQQLIFWPSFEFPDGFYNSLKMGVIGLFLIITILSFNLYYFRRLIQVQKYITILYWFLFTGLITAVFQTELRLEYALLVMPSVGIFLAFIFQSIRNTSLADFLHLGLLVALFYIQFYPKYF